MREVERAFPRRTQGISWLPRTESSGWPQKGQDQDQESWQWDGSPIPTLDLSPLVILVSVSIAWLSVVLYARGPQTIKWLWGLIPNSRDREPLTLTQINPWPG